MIVGELGKKMGFSMGLVMVFVDWLEKVGYVVCEKDLDDCRRVIIVLLMVLKKYVKDLFCFLLELMMDLCCEYIEEELEFIFSFVGKVVDIVEEEFNCLKQ